MSKDYKIHSVRYNLVMNIILKLSSVLFPFITFPYVSRVLGATYNGKISFAASIIYYFTFIASLGIPTYGVKVCAQYRDDKAKLTKTVKELLTILTITTVISYTVFFLAMIFVPKLQEEKTLMLINAAGIFLSVYGVEWFYQAIEQYDYITYRKLAFKIISIILMFTFVHSTEDYLFYAGISVFSTAGSNILNLIRLHKFVDLRTKTKIELAPHIKPILTLFMLSAASMIYTSLDSVMLGFMTNDTQVGLYAASVKIKNILMNLVTALGVVLLPRLSNALAVGKEKEFNKLIKKSFSFSILSSLPLAIFCILQAEQCILFLAGDGYKGAILPMQLISPSIVFIALTNIIGIQILIPKGKEFLTFLSTLVGAIFNLILNSMFIPVYGSSGATFATTMAELSVFVVQLWFIRNSIKDYIHSKNMIKIFISLVIAIVGLQLVSIYIETGMAFIDIVISGMVFFGAYGILLFVLKEEIVYSFLEGIFKRF